MRLVCSSLSVLFLYIGLRLIKLVRVVFRYRPKGRYETGMIRLVRVVFVYRPKGRHETGMIKLVRVV